MIRLYIRRSEKGSDPEDYDSEEKYEENNAEMKDCESKVVSVGKYARAKVPYPVKKAKFVLKKT